MFNFKDLVQVQRIQFPSKLINFPFNPDETAPGSFSSASTHALLDEMVVTNDLDPFPYHQADHSDKKSNRFLSYIISQNNLTLKTHRSFNSNSETLMENSVSNFFLNEVTHKVDFENFIQKEYFTNCSLNEFDKARKTNGIFRYYNAFYRNEESVRVQPEMWDSEPMRQFLFSPTKINFRKEINEPLQCRAALYDIKLGQRISEFAEFSYISQSMQKKHYIFSVDPSPDILLGIQISRVYQKGLESARLHLNNQMVQTLEDKNTKEKFISTLPNAYQELCWTAITLFNEYGSFKLDPDGNNENGKRTSFSTDNSKSTMISMKAGPLQIRKGDYSEEEFIKLITGAKATSKTMWNQKSPKIFDESYLEFDCLLLSEDRLPRNRMNPSLEPLKHSKKVFDDLEETVYEMAMVQTTKEAVPETEPYNNMYLRLLSMSSNKHKNMILEVYFRETDHRDLDMSLENFINDGARKKVCSRAIYGDKSPKSDVEWKVKLPLKVTKKTHFLFVMSNLHSITHKKIKEFVGYAWLPLYSEKGLLADDAYNLKIVNEPIADGYLSGTKKKKTKKLNFLLSNEKNSITIRTELNSSILSNDEKVNLLFSDNGDSTPSDRLKTIKNMEFLNLVRFLPCIINRLMICISDKDKNEKNMGINGIIRTITRLSSEENEKKYNYSAEELLNTWIRFYMCNFKGAPLYLEIVLLCCNQFKVAKKIELELNSINSMSRGIGTTGSKEREMDCFMNSICFLLDTICKSVKLECDSKNELRKKDLFVNSFGEFVTKLCDCCRNYSFGTTADTIEKIITKLAETLKDLYAVLSKEKVYEMAKSVSKRLDLQTDAFIVRMKKKFMQMFYSSQIYTKICRDGPAISKEEIFKIGEMYPLTELLIGNCIEGMRCDVPCFEHVDVLMELLSKEDFDEDLVHRTHVANVYFPYVMEFAKLEIKVDEPNTKTRNALACMLWISQNCNIELFETWWAQCSDKEIKTFIGLLDSSTTTFRFVGDHRQRYDFKSYLSQETIKQLDIKSNTNAINSLQKGLTGISERDENKVNKETIGEGGISKGVNLRELRKRMLANSKRNSTKKIKDLTKQNMESLISLEGNMTEAVSETVYAVMGRFLGAFKNSRPFLDLILCFFGKNLGLTLTYDLYLNLYGLIHYFFLEWREFLNHVTENTIQRFLKELFSYTLQYSVNQEKMIMQKTSFFIYYIARLYFQQKKRDLALIKNSLIVSLYDRGWVVNLTAQQAEMCSKVIEKSAEYCELEEFDGKEDFVRLYKQVIDTTSELFIVFAEITKLNDLKENCDYARYEEILLETAKKYSRIPLIRLNWMKKLISHHESAKNPIEAAECYLEICRLLDTEFQSLNSTDDAAEILKEKNRKGVYINNACHDYQKGGFLEKSATIVNQKYVPLLIEQKDWRTLGSLFRQTAKIFDKLAEDETCEKNAFGTYYLVAFNGEAFGFVDGKKYVYRKKDNVPMEQFSNEIKRKYECTLEEKISIVKNQTLIKQNAPGENNIQVIYVTPLCEEENESKFEKWTYKDKFSYHVRYVEGESRNGVENVCKKMYTITTESVLPSLVTRKEAISIEEEIHSPLQVATYDIRMRISRLTDVVTSNPVNLSVLESVLTGTLLPQVNGGIKIYFEAFYAEGKKESLDRGELEAFEACISLLLESCKLAIDEYKRILVSEKKEKTKSVMCKTICDYYETAAKLVKENIKTN